MGRRKGSKNKTYTVTRAGEKERTGRYTLSDAALQQRRNNVALPVAKDEGEYNDNAIRIQHIIGVQAIAAHADRKDLLSLKSCFLEYLKLCQTNGCSVGNLGAYAAMGFTNEEFFAWSKGGDEERKAFVRFIKSTCALSREAMMNDGVLNPIVGIFWERNFDGLRNDTEQVQSAQERDDLSEESNSYRKRYGNLLGAESDDN